MFFNEKLQRERIRAGLTQKELADKTGLTDRTIQNYESGRSIPKRISSVQSIAKVLGVKSEYLLGEEDMLVADAEERGGAKAKREIRALVSQVSGLFAGGELDEEDRDAAMRALNDAYWKAKEINKKYGRKRSGGTTDHAEV